MMDVVPEYEVLTALHAGGLAVSQDTLRSALAFCLDGEAVDEAMSSLVRNGFVKHADGHGYFSGGYWISARGMDALEWSASAEELSKLLGLDVLDFGRELTRRKLDRRYPGEGQRLIQLSEPARATAIEQLELEKRYPGEGQRLIQLTGPARTLAIEELEFQQHHEQTEASRARILELRRAVGRAIKAERALLRQVDESLAGRPARPLGNADEA